MNSTPSIVALVYAVSMRYDVSIDDVCKKFGPGRWGKRVEPGQIAMYLAHTAGWGPAEIGRVLGGRGDTSIRHAVLEIRSKAETTHLFREELDELMCMAGGGDPIHDSHVRLFYLSYPHKLGRLQVRCCCGVTKRRGDFVRDVSGMLLDHCGCRTGIPPRLGTGVRPPGLSRAEYSRAGRIQGLPGFWAMKHQEHVREYRLHLARIERAEKLARQRAQMERAASITPMDKREQYNRLVRDLSDGYVSKRLKKNMPSLKGVKLPKALIDLERVRLMIVREVRQRNHSE